MTEMREQNTPGDSEIVTPCQQVPWHACPEAETFQRLRSNMDGLNQSQAEERLKEYGRNVLPVRKAPSFWEVVLHQFKNPLIYILLIAGFVSMAIGDVKDSLFIFAVIILNTVIGTVQEWKAEQSAHSLQILLKTMARVRRNGEILHILAEKVVPGDVVLLEAGDRVPADMRLFHTNNLSIDESFLTGESLPVKKISVILDSNVPVSDRANMAFAGAIVTSGRGSGVVVATGSRTEVGHIVASIFEEEGAKPPLIIRMERFSRQVALIVLVFAFILGLLLVGRGAPFSEVFFLMVAMAVSAIPEGLPVAMTVALSLATSRMAQRQVIARRLVAVESLGSCTVIASDKTGTLTVNSQTVKLIMLPWGLKLHVSGQGYNDEGSVMYQNGEQIQEDVAPYLERLARAAVFCNEGSLIRGGEGWRHSGDSMDIALLSLGLKLGISSEDRSAVISEIPFESEKRYAATVYHHANSIHISVKGALEAIAPFCSHMRTLSGDLPMDYPLIEQYAENMAAEGYRILAIAEKMLPEGERLDNLREKDLKNLVFLGLIGFIDPLRPEVKDAVKEAHKAGIRVIMITGDHPATALAIARDLGIAHSQDQVITGAQIAELAVYDSPEFHDFLKKINVYARVSPQQKFAIVDALVKMGEFVAVTGDGVNDAPALKRANIGVAMGSGTDIAKNAAQIIIADDNFASIINGIEEGRFAYANVRKVTLLLISTGFAELIILGLAILLNMPVPLLAAQILWLNLVTNGIQDVALAFEAGEKGVMNMPPRCPTEGIFDRRMIENVLVSGFTMGFICLGFWMYEMRLGIKIDEARNLLFTLLVLMQFFHVLNCRSEYLSAFRIPMRNNRILAVGMLIAFCIHIAALYLPITQSLLNVYPLSMEKWLQLGIKAALVIVVIEIYKALRILPTKKKRCSIDDESPDK